MRRVLLMSLLMLLVTSVAFAQVGQIGIYADAAGSDCRVVDAVPGLLSVYVVHADVGGSNAVLFKVAPSAGVTMTHISDNSAFLLLGNSETSIAVAYGGCMSGTFLILTMGYFASGTTPACEQLDIVPADDSVNGLVEYVDCTDTKHEVATGQSGFIGGDSDSCPCPGTAVRPATWGAIKALYN